MPSTASSTFYYNLDDVLRLVTTYEHLKPTGQGKRGLGHLTRSSIVTLCACWEQYIEDVIIEGVELLRTQIRKPDNLPLEVRKEISKQVRNAKNELKPLELAGNGWKDIYLAYAQDAVGKLHSPKTENIEALFTAYLGLKEPIQEKWTCGKDGVDKFVRVRNVIAHKGRASGKYIKFWEVGHSIELVKNTVIETDNYLSEYFADILPKGRPWRRRHA
jgi:hypothetical protein